MKRRDFFKTGGAVALLSGLGIKKAHGFIPAHNWDKYDFGSGPTVKDRLYQGPFPQYPPEQVIPGSEVVMATTPSKEVVPNYGMGLTVYIAGDLGPPPNPVGQTSSFLAPIRVRRRSARSRASNGFLNVSLMLERSKLIG